MTGECAHVDGEILIAALRKVALGKRWDEELLSYVSTYKRMISESYSSPICSGHHVSLL